MYLIWVCKYVYVHVYVVTTYNCYQICRYVGIKVGQKQKQIFYFRTFYMQSLNFNGKVLCFSVFYFYTTTLNKILYNKYASKFVTARKNFIYKYVYNWSALQAQSI